jgi:GT2 family glycosyltransferase
VSDLACNSRVICIVLNWNGWEHTVECLAALRACTYPHLTVVVVDNGSTDDSVSRICAAYPGITLLQTDKNLGFAGGNNVGIRHALEHGADYVWLLNNDTIPAPDALSALVAKAVADGQIGAVASICYCADSPTTVQVWAGSRVNLWLGYVSLSTKPHEDDWFDALNGASLLLSRPAIEEVGLLDENFFLYWEDVEFSLRLRKRAWRIAAAADSRVLHKVNASTGGNKVVLDRYYTASGLRLLRLYAPAPYLAMLLFLSLRFGIRLLRFELVRCKSVWAGLRDYWTSRSSTQERRIRYSQES